MHTDEIGGCIGLVAFGGIHVVQDALESLGSVKRNMVLTIYPSSNIIDINSECLWNFGSGASKSAALEEGFESPSIGC